MKVIIPDSKLNYTKEGNRRLALTIKANLSKNGWSARYFAKLIGVSANTAVRYVKGSFCEPRPKTLIAIYPYICKPKHILRNGNKLEVILSDEKCDDWVELAMIATDNFQEIEREITVSTSALIFLIQSSMEINKLSQNQVEEELYNMQQAGTAIMSVERFKQIQKGVNYITDDELRIIRALVDRYETAYSETAWILGVQDLLLNPDQKNNDRDKNGSTNGVSS